MTKQASLTVENIPDELYELVRETLHYAHAKIIEAGEKYYAQEGRWKELMMTTQISFPFHNQKQSA